MRAQELQAKLRQAFLDNSLYETDRDYLGMSGVGECPRAWYWRTVEPVGDERMIWYAWAGYTWEARVLALLGAEQVRRHIVSKFDSRYRGHTDHELPDGTLVEVKSVGWDRYLMLLAKGRGDRRNKAQCQAYMRHGAFPHAILVYVARDIPWQAFDNPGFQLPFFTVDVYRNEAWMEELDDKARMVLAAMDARTPPDCQCGYCRR